MLSVALGRTAFVSRTAIPVRMFCACAIGGGSRFCHLCGASRASCDGRPFGACEHSPGNKKGGSPAAMTGSRPYIPLKISPPREFDIYRKIPKDLTQPTVTGAVISILSCFFISILFLSEFISYMSPELVSELYVDNPSSADKIPVSINITLLKLDCSVVGLDIQDDMGRHEVGFVENTEKTPVGSGCRFEGKFFIHKVPGNFHVSTHAAAKQPDKIDMTHIIHDLTFGVKMTDEVRGSFNSLDEMDKSGANAIESHDYVMKIVPTVYEKSKGERIESYQYTYAYKSYVSISHSGRIMPAIWFRYDLTPITVKYTRRSIPLYSFLTSVCAIVGGTFTVAGIVDSLVFTASEVFRKFEMGKLS